MVIFHSIEFHVKGKAEEVWTYTDSPEAPIVYRPNVGEIVRLPKEVRNSNHLPESLRVESIEHVYYDGDNHCNHYVLVHCVEISDRSTN